MAINLPQSRQLLKQSEFSKLFIEELGWDRHDGQLSVSVDGLAFDLKPIAEKRGMVAYLHPVDGQMPDYATRRKIERNVAKSSHEHLIIFFDEDSGSQVWQWVKREAGRPAACREHTYHTSQSGEALLQKLQAIAFDLDEEEGLTLVDVTSRVRAGFDVERVTKRFYDIFKKEHAAFLKLLAGIPDEDLQRWYASVMLNRLMFIYFIQKKGFLNGDLDYLRTRLAESKSAGKDRFYRHVLCPLFFEGFAKKPEDRSAVMNKLLGQVPYLNGGLFLKHQIEKAHGKDIDIPDRAFEKIFAFFDNYQWHLDERPLRDDTEINPDVLGYIFEKYINQKQMGAYYTKEDITGYITRNTVIPFLFDAARTKCKIAFEGERSVWRLLAEDPDRYIYPAMRHGLSCDIHTGDTLDAPRKLPANIAAGLDDVSQRGDWNTPAAPEFALPTEIWREVVARRQRCQEVRDKLAAGEVRDINDLITLNLDIEQFAQDVIETCEGPELLRAIWGTIAGKIPGKSNEKHHQGVTVLDPACGSGAFLFAALNQLEALYEACLDRMQSFLDELDRTGEASGQKYSDFRKILGQIDQHPSRKYFVYKSIVIQNLYGVDIMEEAVEICKLRLFLKLVAQVDRVEDIEPLPDIDFNIRAGNSLVGYATYDHVKKAVTTSRLSDRVNQGKLVFEQERDAMGRIEDKAREVDELFALFRQQQTTLGGTVTAEDKQALEAKLADLDEELNQHLATEYGIDPTSKKKYGKWLDSHQPFHWFVHFYGIMAAGGFDVVIGNPPYVSTSRVNYLSVAQKGLGYADIYGLFVHQSSSLSSGHTYSGMIVPLSLTFSRDFGKLREHLTQNRMTWLSSYDNIPAAVFEGVSQRCTIWISTRHGGTCLTSRMHRWRSQYRSVLMQMLEYTPIQTEHCAGFGLPKVPSVPAADLLCAFAGSGLPRQRECLLIGRSGEHQVGFSQAARNFVSVFRLPPPCVSVTSGEEVAASKIGYVPCTSDAAEKSVLISLAGELYLWYWLLRGDGFDVTGWIVRDFADCLCYLPDTHYGRLSELGKLLDSRRNEALVFKKNAGKYVGNYNYRSMFPITRRGDLLILAGLGISCDLALSVLDHVHRVLSINAHAGERAIPASVKAKYLSEEYDRAQQEKLFSQVDQILMGHYGFTDTELGAILSYDARSSESGGDAN